MSNTNAWLQSKGHTLWAQFELPGEIDKASAWFDRQLDERFEYITGDPIPHHPAIIEVQARTVTLEGNGVEVKDARTAKPPVGLAPPDVLGLTRHTGPVPGRPAGFFKVQTGSKFVAQTVPFSDEFEVTLPDWEPFTARFEPVPGKPGWIQNAETVYVRHTP